MNEAFRMYDERLGQSVTLSGRSIVRHMNAQINLIIAGEYDYKGDSIIYADTDSCYFSASEYARSLSEKGDLGKGLSKEELDVLMGNTEDAIAFYDTVADLTNDTFPEFMHNTFGTSLERGGIIKAGRELFGSTGLFIKKKKYAILMVEKEGKRLDKDGKPGKLKVMGLDLKRSDTPKYMQAFLEKLLMDLLCGKAQTDMYADIKEFRAAFSSRPGWEKGAPKKISNLSKYGSTKPDQTISLDGKKDLRVSGKKEKNNLPGHARASMNWNELCEMHSDRFATRISDGTRIIVCKLKKNAFDMTSVAYPIDEAHLPEWFQKLPFDHAAMEETIIDKKINNLIGVLEWNLAETKERGGDEFFSWS